MGCASHGVCGLASAGDTSPGKVFRCVSPGDIAFFPRYAENFRNHAMNVTDGFSPKIADAGLNGDPPVRANDKQTVITRRAGEKSTQRYTHSTNFCAAAFGLSHALFPAKLFCSAIQSLFEEATG